jgi:hypothetical protein
MNLVPLRSMTKFGLCAVSVERLLYYRAYAQFYDYEKTK